MTGWDVDFLQEAVDQCTNLSGTIEDCAIFNIQSEDDQRQCKLETMPSLLKVENVLGGDVDVLTALPGNVAIQYGPERATVNTGDEVTSAASLSSTYSAPSLTYASGSSTPGAVFYQSSAPSAAADTAKATILDVPQVYPTVAASPATTAAPTRVSGVDYEVVSTGYFTNGRVVSEIVYEEAIVYVTEDIVTTVTVNPPAARSEQKRTHDHMLRHRHHAGRR